MHTKLILDIDDNLFHQIEMYAKERNKSVSQVVIDYFQELTQKSKPIPPVTQSLIGILKNSELDESDYKQHLRDKYL